MSRQLFRKHALEAHRDKFYGHTLLDGQPSLGHLAMAAALVGALIFGFAVWGEYDRKEHVTGYLAPANALIDSYTPQAGTVLEEPADGQAATPLQAQLLVPERVLRFIKPGQTVALRYRAFPYQRFGHYAGRVTELGQIATQPDESNPSLRVHEPMHIVTVRLPAQHVLADGRNESLQAGMQVDADVGTDRRRMIEWFFDSIIAPWQVVPNHHAQFSP